MASIVIADDMLTVQHNLAFILQSYNYNVVGKASNCTEAIMLYREKKPDILIGYSYNRYLRYEFIF